MKNRFFKMTACVVAVVCVFCACKKKEVSLDKMKAIISQSVIAEESDSGRVLVVDSIILNQTGGDNYTGLLFGVANDSIPVVYDLTVDDAGDDLEIEWNKKEAE